MAIQRMQEQEREIQFRKQQAQQMLYSGPQMYGGGVPVNQPYQPVPAGYPQYQMAPEGGQQHPNPPPQQHQQPIMGQIPANPLHYQQQPQMAYPQSLPPYNQVGIASPPPPYSMPEGHYHPAAMGHPQPMGYPPAPYSGPIGGYYASPGMPMPQGGYQPGGMPPQQQQYQQAPSQPPPHSVGYAPQHTSGPQQQNYQNAGGYQQQPPMPNPPGPVDYQQNGQMYQQQQQPGPPRASEAQLISFD